MKKISGITLSSVLSLSAFALPMVTFAQGGGVRQLIQMVGGIVQALIPIVIGLAVLVFLWGVLNYVIKSDDPGKKEAKDFMLWGIIALFVMVSVWGLVNILRDTLDLNPATPSAPAIPRVQG